MSLNKIILLAIIGATLLNTGAAMSGLVGACETKNYTSYHINPAQYLGHWYELGHSKSFIFDLGCYCTTAQYGLNPNGTVSVSNACHYLSVKGPLVVNNGTAVITDPSKPGSLMVYFGPHGAPYDVVLVDEQYNWSIVVSCDATPFFGGSNIWILSRTPTLEPSLYATLKEKAALMGFVMDDYVDSVQTC
eukprot:TRINITY_DN66_c0_g1_i2.p1 TRINITY_DN66_c0_g1~~TRINITY_DN66_c0_g1_i2.p1  ORF type:complete len:190 (-),score=69.30 TRINITY_DN66_c0_g1_i2:274-843(-)